VKKLVVVLSVAVLVVVIFPCLSVLAQPTYTPHQNPATAEESSDMTSLLIFYGDVFNLAVLRQYQDAQSILSELEYANIPDELRYLTDRYNSLSQQLFSAMNEVEYLLDKASTLFSSDQFSEARQQLAAAEVAIHDILLLMEDTEAATDALAEKLGVFAALASSEITQAYERLDEMLERLMQLIDELRQLRDRLSDNPQTVVDSHFYLPTLLEVSAPETVYPGIPFTVGGQVTSTDGAQERLVEVFLDDTLLAEEMLYGQFSLEVTTPPQVSSGKHILTVVVASHERYAGVSRRMVINISQLPIQADVEVPRISFFAGSVQVRGRVYYGSVSLEGAVVSIIFQQASTTVRTASDGSFDAVIEMPSGLSLIGFREITTVVEPSEVWYASLRVDRRIFTVNAANTGLMLVILLALGVLAYTGVRARPRRVSQEAVAPQGVGREPVSTTPSPRRRYEFTGIRGGILSAYLDVLAVVERVTGVSMESSTTLREFLEISAPHLAGAVVFFAELTTMAEVALYSGRDPDAVAVARAEQIVAIVKEELGSGAS
jgi:hypothetical protein